MCVREGRRKRKGKGVWGWSERGDGGRRMCVFRGAEGEMGDVWGEEGEEEG